MRLRQETKNNFTKLTEELIELKKVLNFNQREITGDINEIHDKNFEFHDRLTDLENDVYSEIKKLKEELILIQKEFVEFKENSFSTNYLLIEELIRINQKPLTPSEKKLDELLMECNLNQGDPSKFRQEFQQIYNQISLVRFDEAIETIMDFRSEKEIELNLMNVLKVILLNSNLSKLDTIYSLMKLT